MIRGRRRRRWSYRTRSRRRQAYAKARGESLEASCDVSSAICRRRPTLNQPDAGEDKAGIGAFSDIAQLSEGLALRRVDQAQKDRRDAAITDEALIGFRGGEVGAGAGSAPLMWQQELV
jgi:hypothetical protein